MKKKQIYYLVVWIALIILFNILCFVTPTEISGVQTFSGAFWPGYVCITVSFVCHLVFSIICLGENNREKRVLNMPLIIISYFELIIMIIIGIGCMVLPIISNWLGIILCYAILVVSVLIFVSAIVVGENTLKANTALNVKGFQMREIANQASELISMANDDETKTLMQKIFDAIRYSDPTSTEETYTEETEVI